MNEPRESVRLLCPHCSSKRGKRKFKNINPEMLVGMCVKVAFKTKDPMFEVENMWVKIIQVEGKKLIGNLANEPLYSDLEFGQEIIVNLDDIIDIAEFETETKGGEKS